MNIEGYVQYRTSVLWNYTVHLTGHERTNRSLFHCGLYLLKTDTLLTFELFVMEYGLIYEDLENCAPK